MTRFAEVFSFARPAVATTACRLLFLSLLSALCCNPTLAQKKLAAAPAKAEPPATVLLISDIHLDPFQDPAKVPQLVKAPITEWTAILEAPPSATQEADFAKVRERCGKKVFDTSPALMRSSYTAVASHQKEISLAVLTGDLVAHNFSCRYEAVLPGRPEAEVQEFLQKTARYVIEELAKSLGDKPLYVSLGNNDTECGDYKLNQKDKLFSDLAESVSHAAGQGSDSAFAAEYRKSGHFLVPLPKPFQQTKLLVLDNLSASRNFTTCGGEKDASLAKEDIVWLKQELQKARDQNQQVWVATHIPPGIDAYYTFKAGNVCALRQPIPFLSSDELATTLVSYSDVVKLALFGHTHMDEFRILLPNGGADTKAAGVPAKIVPGISPNAGNNPTFLLASIDPKTAVMQDYTAYSAFMTDEGKYSWVSEYKFSSIYKSTFSADGVSKLIQSFQQDITVSKPMTKEYIGHYAPGLTSFAVTAFWPKYQCILTNRTSETFLNCACGANGK